MPQKKVTRRYAQNEFSMTGLVLILYSLFVLYVPLVLSYLFEEMPLGYYKFINLEYATRTVIMILGTILPFAILGIKNRSYIKSKNKLKMPFKEILKHSLIFFSLESAAIFAMTSVASYFNISGELVSGIGISISSEYMDDFVYVLTFIFISPILEEYAFRKILLNSLSKYGKYFALIATSVIFALAHGSFMEFVPSFIMGIILGKISLRYKNHKPCTWIHIIFNAILYGLFVLPEKYSLYSAIILAIIYVLSVVLYLTKIYKHITIRKAAGANKVFSLFVGTYSVIFAMVLFIVHSLITVVLKL